jgi:hypothetical protein
VHLDVGVAAGVEPAEYLEDRRVVVDQRGVALLVGDRQAARIERQWLVVRPSREPELVVRPPGLDARQPGAGDLLVVQRVVPPGLASVVRVRRLAEQHVRDLVGRFGPAHQRHLVRVGGAVVRVAHTDQPDVAAPWPLGKDADGGDRDDPEGASLAGEPALPRQPSLQQSAELLGHGHHCPSSAGAGSRNQ